MKIWLKIDGLVTGLQLVEVYQTICKIAAIQIEGTAYSLYSVEKCSNFQLRAVRTCQLGRLEHSSCNGAFDVYGYHATNQLNHPPSHFLPVIQETIPGKPLGECI